MQANYVSKKSAWGAVSIWTVLFFGLILPVALVAVPLFMKEELGDVIFFVGIGAAVCSFVITVICTAVAIYRAKQVSYEFYGNTVVIKDGAVFSGAEENRRLFFFPGMSISVKQSLKGKIFGYGNVVVSMGIGAAGQIVMEGIKKPKQAKEILSKYAAGVSDARANNRMCFTPWMMGFPYFF